MYDLLQDEDTVLYLNLFVLLYADDTILLAETPDQLQLALNGLYEFCVEKKLQVNSSKTKIMIFSRGKVRNKPVFDFGGNVLDIVDDYVYLGVKFNYNGNSKKCVKRLYDIASRAMFEVLKKGKKLHLDIDTQIKLFDSTVLPILLYGSEVWGYNNVDIIEKLHLRFLKILLNVKKSTPSCMIYGETASFPLDIMVNSRMVNYWFKLCTEIRPKINVVLYKLLYRLYTIGSLESSWIKHIKSVLDKLGLSNIWLNQGNGINLEWLKRKVKLVSHDQFKQSWASIVNDSSKCLNYRIFKTEFCFENYLVSMSKKDRLSMIRFRCRNNKLPIETGSYFNTPRETRYCTKCEENMLGDEFHVLLECAFFKKERKQFLSNVPLSKPSIISMYNILNSKGDSLNKLGKFISIILSNF